MAEYIERQAAIDAIKNWDWQELYLPVHFQQVLEEIPPADVRPVVRGRWIVRMSEIYPADSTIECDQCHEVQTAFISDSFCPNCGADMRTGGDAE